MEKELQQKLFDTCPLFYRFRTEQERYCNQHNMLELGVLCGDGWYQLLLDVSVKVESIIRDMKQSGYEENSLPVALWVKEKYGELLFDTDNSTVEIDRLVGLAETESAYTCAVCGKPGTMRDRGWLSCLCRRCSL